MKNETKEEKKKKKKIYNPTFITQMIPTGSRTVNGANNLLMM